MLKHTPRSTRAHLAFALSTLAACGGGGNPSPDGGGADMQAALDRPLAVVAGSDYKTGALATYGLRSNTVSKARDVLDAQPLVRVFGSSVYVLDQTHGALRIYNLTSDPAQDFKNPNDYSLSSAAVPAAKANPHDIYVDIATQRAFVTFYGAYQANLTSDHALAVIDLKNPSNGVARFIKLAVNPADPDNNPEADHLFACGGTLYVTLQDLDETKTFAPAAPGRLAAIPLSGAETPTYIQLAGQDPTAVSIPGGDCTKAIIGHADNQYGGGAPTGKGGVEVIDLTTGHSQGLVLLDSALGGYVSTLDAADLSHVFVDLLTASGQTYFHNVYVADASARTKGAKIAGAFASVPEIRVSGSQLLLLSSGAPAPGMMATGLYLGKTDGSPLTASPIDLGLPPVSLDILP